MTKKANHTTHSLNFVARAHSFLESNQPKRLEALLTTLEDNESTLLLQLDGFHIFSKAAALGNSEAIEILATKAKALGVWEELSNQDSYRQAFTLAARKGHHEVVARLAELAPEKLEWLIEFDNSYSSVKTLYSSVKAAIFSENLETIRTVMGFASPVQRQLIIQNFADLIVYSCDLATVKFFTTIVKEMGSFDELMTLGEYKFFQIASMRKDSAAEVMGILAEAAPDHFKAYKKFIKAALQKAAEAGDLEGARALIDLFPAENNKAEILAEVFARLVYLTKTEAAKLIFTVIINVGLVDDVINHKQYEALRYAMKNDSFEIVELIIQSANDQQRIAILSNRLIARLANPKDSIVKFFAGCREEQGITLAMHTSQGPEEDDKESIIDKVLSWVLSGESEEDAPGTAEIKENTPSLEEDNVPTELNNVQIEVKPTAETIRDQLSV